jgi:hypothetical protein
VDYPLLDVFLALLFDLIGGHTVRILEHTVCGISFLLER